jgi:hypothetical protein
MGAGAPGASGAAGSVGDAAELGGDPPGGSAEQAAATHAAAHAAETARATAARRARGEMTGRMGLGGRERRAAPPGARTAPARRGMRAACVQMPGAGGV